MIKKEETLYEGMCRNYAEFDALRTELYKKVQQLEKELATYKAGNVPVTQIIADNEAMAIQIEQLEAKLFSEKACYEGKEKLLKELVIDYEKLQAELEQAKKGEK